MERDATWKSTERALPRARLLVVREDGAPLGSVGKLFARVPHIQLQRKEGRTRKAIVSGDRAGLMPDRERDVVWNMCDPRCHAGSEKSGREEAKKSGRGGNMRESKGRGRKEGGRGRVQNAL
eukprot:2303119-Rhodomonas_salina.2